MVWLAGRYPETPWTGYTGAYTKTETCPPRLATLALVCDREHDEHGAASRRCAIALLERSQAYENVIVPPGTPPEWAVVVSLVARQRSHLKAIVTLADVGLSLGAEIIDRTMFEFFVRLKWLLIDAELHRILWMLDDIGYRFTIDAEVREWAAKSEREIEILRDDVRERLEVLQADLRERIASIAADRQLDRHPRYPRLSEQAEAVGNAIDYSMGYRLNSQSAAHPSVIALQNLAEELPDGSVRILAEPVRDNRLNVYGTGSVYLFEALDLAGELIPQLRIEGLDEIGEELQELAVMRLLEENPSDAPPTDEPPPPAAEDRA